MGNAKKRIKTGKDYTWGYPFRVYSNFTRGQRLNRVSIGAEAWFWRLHTVADHFGNGNADPRLVWSLTIGLRQGVTSDDVAGYLVELSGVHLVLTYTEAGQTYFHIVGWCLRQKTANGERVHQVPASPWDATELRQAKWRETEGKQKKPSGADPLNPQSSSFNPQHSDINNSSSHSSGSAAEGEEDFASARELLRIEGGRARKDSEKWGEEEIDNLLRGTVAVAGSITTAVRYAISNANVTNPKRTRKGYIVKCLSSGTACRLLDERKLIPMPAVPAKPTDSLGSIQDWQAKARAFVAALDDETFARAAKAAIASRPPEKRAALEQGEPRKNDQLTYAIYDRMEAPNAA